MATPPPENIDAQFERLIDSIGRRAVAKGFTLRPANPPSDSAADAPTLTDVVDCMFGVQRRALMWTRNRGAAWHQHWATHVVALRGALVLRKPGP